VGKCLSEAASLGTAFLRSDIRWLDLLPDGETVNEEVSDWYRSYFLMVRAKGMEPIVVLSNPPSNIRHFKAIKLRRVWEKYVHEVVHRFGDLCDTYQVLNEPNNPGYQIFPHREAGAAIVSAAKIIHGQISGARVIVNILAGIFNWKREATILLRECGDAIDVLGLDYYPGTWTIIDDPHWTQIKNFLLELNSDNNGLLSDGFRFAILETGYASNVRFLRGEDQQVNYFCQLGRVLDEVGACCGSRGLAYVGIYELCDSNSFALLDPEAHFGLLESHTLARKAAYSKIQEMFSHLT